MEFMLTKNPLRDDGKFFARIINQGGMSFEELLKEMEDNTAIRKQDLRLAVTQFFKAVTDNLIKGLKVQTPLGTFKPTIRGSFNSLEEDFRPSAATNNHHLKILIRPSAELSGGVLPNLRAEKIMENSIKYPSVIVYENSSDTMDDGYHPGNVLKMRGINLKFDPDAEDEGVFWINSAGESVKATSISHNTPSALHCQIPELAPGEYIVEIASRLKNHQLRTAPLDDPITVS